VKNPLSISTATIVLAGYEVPGHGGASTALYALFRKMQNLGANVHLINIVDEEDDDYFHYIFGDEMGNPDNLDNVHNCILKQSEFFADPRRSLLKELVHTLRPDVMIGMDAIPSLMLKQCMPDTNVIYLACGSEQASNYIRSGRTRDAISLASSFRPPDYPPHIFPCRERLAMDYVDLILANSEMVSDFFRHFYPTAVGKIFVQPVWFAEWIVDEARVHQDLSRPFSERQYDVLFVSSLWSRRVKNYSLAEKIISDCRDLNVCVAGEIEHPLKHATLTGLVNSRKEMFRLMGNARSVVSTSLVDAAPGILFEASAMGCNVIASRNCGNWGLCNDNLLVDPYIRSGFVRAIRKGAQMKYPDKLDDFLELKGFNTLLDAVELL
jgi:glycosyltransferase involved in cell wall biosynthesis